MRGSAMLIRRISLRRARERPLRSALTIGGVAVGVALVFSVRTVDATLIESARASARALAGAARLEVAATDQHGLPAGVAGRIARIDGVRRAVPVLRVTARVSGPGSAVRTQVFGVTPAVVQLFGPAAAAEPLLAGGPEAIVLSRRLRGRLRARVGERIAVETPSGPVALQVGAEVDARGLREINGGEFAAVALQLAQKVFGREGRISSVYVVLDPGADVRVVRGRIERAVGAAASVGPPGERTEAFETGFEVLTALVSLGSGVGLFVAVFIVFNTMGVAITERRREIATTLMLGTARRQLSAALAVEAALLGIIGSALGTALGLGLTQALVRPTVDAYEFIFPDTAVGPVVVTPGNVVLALAGGPVVALVGALAPVRRIRRIALLEALRPRTSEDVLAFGSRHRASRLRPGAAGAILASAGGAGLVLYAVGDRDSVAPLSLALVLAGVTPALARLIPVTVRGAGSILRALFGINGRIAADALVRHPRRTTFTVAALLLPGAMAIAIGAAIASYERQAERDALAWHGTPLKLSSESFSLFGSDQPLEAGLASAIERIPGVRHVYPERRLLIDLDGEPVALYALPIARSLQDQAAPRISPIRATETELVDALAAGGMLVSSYMAERRALSPGDRLTLPTPQGERAFTIAGTFDDLAPFESVFLEYGHYRRVWEDKAADEFSLVLDDGASIEDVAGRLDRLAASHSIRADVLTRAEKVEQVLENVRGLTSLARAIQFAALLAAALAIGNTLFTSVHDRQWELALGRLVGMRPSDVGRSILLEAGTIGAVGGAGAITLGIPLGALIVGVLELRFSWSIPFEPSWNAAVVVLGAGVAMALLAAVYPRRLAVRAPIVAALRYE